MSDQPDAPYYRASGSRAASSAGQSRGGYGSGSGFRAPDERWTGDSGSNGDGGRYAGGADYPTQYAPGNQWQSDPRQGDPRQGDPRQRDRYQASRYDQYDQGAAQRTRAGRGRRERGLPGWLAVLVLIAIAGASGLIDSLSGSAIRGVFNYGLVVASLVAILVVKRSQMFPVVVSPPLVYFVASAALLYIRTGGLHDRGKLIDAATNWIVYGFPAIAGATAVVLVVAGLRMVTRR